MQHRTYGKVSESSFLGYGYKTIEEASTAAIKLMSERGMTVVRPAA